MPRRFDPAGLRSIFSVSSHAQHGRFTTIDGLRGIASFAVVLYHINIAVADAHPDWAPAILRAVFESGWIGVQVFFVLSGFVIAYSIRKVAIGPRFLGRFALRRMARLDPPYLVSIALALALTAISTRLFPDLHKEFPSWPALAAHVIYLQELLGFEHVVDVYWTLCLEVQFYLLLVAFVGVVKRTAGSRNWTAPPWFPLAFGALMLASLGQYFDLIDISPRGLFLPYWYFFALGAAACWDICGELDRRVFPAAWMLVVVFVLLDPRPRGFDLGPPAGLLTALYIVTAGRRQKLGAWLAERPVQYLGAISYSLYLIHPIIGWRTVSVLKRIAGDEFGVGSSAMIFVIGVAASILASHLFYCLIERPSHRLSRRVRMD